MNINIRTMQPSDLAKVVTIQAEAYENHFLESADVIAQRFKLSPQTAWVAELDNEVSAYLVAYCYKLGKVNPFNATFVQVEDPDCLYLHDLALLQMARGTGIATRLIQMAVDFAQYHSLSFVALVSVQSSKEFWQKQGFTEYSVLTTTQHKALNGYGSNGDEVFYLYRMLINPPDI